MSDEEIPPASDSISTDGSRTPGPEALIRASIAQPSFCRLGPDVRFPASVLLRFSFCFSFVFRFAFRLLFVLLFV